VKRGTAVEAHQEILDTINRIDLFRFNMKYVEGNLELEKGS
jgi:hypothetical protein